MALNSKLTPMAVLPPVFTVVLLGILFRAAGFWPSVALLAWTGALFYMFTAMIYNTWTPWRRRGLDD